MAERELRRQHRNASISSDDDDSEGGNFWTNGITSTRHSDEESSEYSDTSTAEEGYDDEDKEELQDPEDMLMQDGQQLFNSSRCGQHSRPISEMRKEEHSKLVFVTDFALISIL
jgi:hypothetical protein